MILHRTTSSDSHFQPQQNQATKTKHNKAIFHLEHSTILELLLTTREKKKNLVHLGSIPSDQRAQKNV